MAKLQVLIAWWVETHRVASVFEVAVNQVNFYSWISPEFQKSSDIDY